jgi:DNA polymerase-3 subunit delta
MVAVKAADVDAFVARPDPARPVVLVFGPDAGLVSERVNAIVKASVDDPNDPFALARLESEDVAADPSRLVEEALTIPLFGGRRAVWVRREPATSRRRSRRCLAPAPSNAAL